MTEVTIKNTQPGDRSVIEDGVAVFIAPGDTVTVDLSDAELASAKGTGYFEFGDDGKAGSEFTKLSTKELTELAEAMEVMPEVGSGKDGKVIKADIVAALEAADSE